MILDLYPGLFGFILLLAIYTWRKLRTSQQYSVDSYFTIMVEKALLENKISEIEADLILQDWSDCGFDKVSKAHEIRQIIVDNNIYVPDFYLAIDDFKFFTDDEFLTFIFNYFKDKCITYSDED